MSTFPATNSNEAVELIIDGGNQLHQIINEDATTEIQTESGPIPSVRKALADSLLFLEPVPWQQGSDEISFNQLRTFNGNIYWAPTATLSNPIPMGATPIGDSNWNIAPFNSSPVYSSLEELIASNSKVGTRAGVYGGKFYDIYSENQGNSVPLTNGLYASPLSESAGDIDVTNVSQYSVIYFSDVDEMVNQTASKITTEVLDSRDIECTTICYSKNEQDFQKSGGGTYTLTTLERARENIGDTGWLPDGYLSYYIFNSLDYVAIIKPSANRLLLSQCGLKDSLSDQADDIQKVFELTASKGLTCVVDREYWVSPRNQLMKDGLSRPVCIQVPDNSRVEFLPSAKIKQLPSTNDTSYVLNFYLQDNIKLWNPEVWGDKDEHLGTSGEFGHCYNITSCSNVELVNPKAFNAWGDGYYVGLEYQGTTSKHLENVKIKGAVYDNISRNGLSFTSGKNVNIEVIKGGIVDRVNPKAGIDIEPEIGSTSPIKPTYEDCNLWLNTSNSQTGLLVFVSSPDIVENFCINIHSLNSKQDTTPLQLEKNIISNISGYLSINNFISDKSKSSPIYLKWMNDGLVVNVNSVLLNDSNYDGPIDDPQDSSFIFDGEAGKVYGGWYFNKVRRINSQNTPLLYRNKVDNVQDSLIDFSDLNITQASTSNLGRMASNSNIIGKNSVTFFQINSKDNALSEVNLSPSTPDGITVTLNDEVGFTQTYTKTAVNSYPVAFEPEVGTVLYYEGSSVNSISSNSYGATIRILDSGSDKIAVPLSGVWSTT